MTDFLLYALLAGLGVAAVAGPLGCFVVWRRMAYFGDTLAHSALLGVALGVLLEVNLSISVAAVPLLMALGLVYLEQRGILSLDTLLGILSHSALATGLVVISLLPDMRVDLISLLFGDLLSVTVDDLYVIYAVAAAVLGLLILLWKPLISITVQAELAAVEGIKVSAVRTALMLITALVIAIAMKIVGVLLITAAHYSGCYGATNEPHTRTNGVGGQCYRDAHRGLGSVDVVATRYTRRPFCGCLRGTVVYVVTGGAAERLVSAVVCGAASRAIRTHPPLSAMSDEFR